MVALFDLDSLVYDAKYRIISFADARKLIAELGKKKARMDVVEQVYNRMEQMINQILTEVEGCVGELDETIYYLTYNLDPYRNKIDPQYKKNRKKDKWAVRIRNYIIQDENFEVKYDFQWEADDLIYDKAASLREKGIDYVVISKDKDLKQIEGAYFDYYKEDTGETNDYFRKIKTYRGLSVQTKEDTEYLLAYQMIAGDNVDNIKGIPGKGEVKAKKIIKDRKGYGLLRAVYAEYRKYYKHPFIAKTEFRKTYNLVKLGKR